MKQNITKQFHVCVAVYDLRTAWLVLELALSREEIPKHMHSIQYPFEVFKCVNSFMSLCRRRLDKVWTVLFCNSTIIIVMSRAQRPLARCALSHPFSQAPTIYRGPARGVQLRLGRGRAGQGRV